MKNLPIGIQTFSEIIENNYVYVDKTANIHTLITTGKCYFLARPRRFGKSLLVSTLAEIFLGNRELFKGLAIDSLNYEWKKHPVITISLSDVDCSTPEKLVLGIKRQLHKIASEFELILSQDIPPGAMLQDLIEGLAKKAQVVLLIDEYDYPILKHIHNPEIAKEMREILRNFYIVIKGLDRYLKFVFLTGVSRFSKTSIFSGLNQLEEISFWSETATLLGYTENEIRSFFVEHLNNATKKLSLSTEELLLQMRKWYNGYSFQANFSLDQNVYNPFSVLTFFKQLKFSNYWFATGTPDFLINLIKTRDYPVLDFENIQATESELNNFDIDNISLVTLLFQTGYLTIKRYDSVKDLYYLNYPNKETSDSFVEYIFGSMTSQRGTYLKNITGDVVVSFATHNFEQLKKDLTHLFALVPYTIHIGLEKYYQTIFYLVLKMMNAEIFVEQPTNIGRIDAILETSTTCFIIEFKIKGSARAALAQIEERKYFEAHQKKGKKVILVGIAFDPEIKNISGITTKKL